MKFRNMILVLTIAFSAIFVSMLGTSYAYYVATDGTTINVTTSNIDAGIATVFMQSQYINLNTGVPINDADVDTLAKSALFTITPDSEVLSENDVAITIGIVDISVASSLITDEFKYRLSCTDGSNITNYDGTGLDFTNSVIENDFLKLAILSTSDNTFDINKTYTCDLKFWISESGQNQNYLMNKNIKGLIRVNTLFRGKG